MTFMMYRTIDPSDESFRPAEAAPSLHELLQDCCGVATSMLPDYSSNTVYLDGFGR